MEHVEEGLDNTNALASIVETGDMGEVHMILGDRERIRHAGVIRPGIKIPLANCSQAQKDLYSRMLDEGHGFESIDAEMLKIAAKGYDKKTCLRPSNSDYFTIRDQDFKRPADAEYIRTKFADPDGKVRRLPCWFSISDLEKVIPHNFRAFSGDKSLRCVSFYDGSKLKFRYLPKDIKAPKAEHWKILDTEDEDEASKVCGFKVQFGGMYRLSIPGLRTVGEVLVPTRSWFGMADAVAVLRRVKSILGRFDGLFQGDTFLELVKVPEMIKGPDGKKVQQWIVTLELAVDPMELARYAEPQRVASRGMAAMQMLSGSPAQRPEPAPAVAPAADPPLPEVPESPAEEPKPDNSAGIKALHDLVGGVGLSPAQFDAWAAFQSSGEALEDHSVDALKGLYRSVRDRIKNDQAGFVAEVQDIARSAK